MNPIETAERVQNRLKNSAGDCIKMNFESCVTHECPFTPEKINNRKNMCVLRFFRHF